MGRLLKFAAYAAVIAAAFYVLPHGKRALDLRLAADDPAQLTDLQLADGFSADVVRREIAEALDKDDIELAESFKALAVERNIAVPEDLKARLAEAQSPAMQSSRTAGKFGRGFVTGQTDDIAGLAGAAAGDLIGWGDVRDLVREGWHAVSGQEVNRLLVGMSAVGLAVTAWTYLSAGAVAPVREGLSVAKAAGRSERLGKDLVESVERSVANGSAERIGAAFADLGAVESKAGTRATLQGLREVEDISEVSKLKQLANVKGRSTLAILKTLGRNAFILGAVAVTAAGWILGAIVNLFFIVLAVQKGFIALVRKLWPRRTTRFVPAPVAALAATD
ncbi:MAG TPA: hypothetical protein VKT73_12695 [Xanthobacteraceae bacterium]|nr:hypothetical protein [Xanthobacteraceae bacterium]